MIGLNNNPSSSSSSRRRQRGRRPITYFLAGFALFYVLAILVLRHSCYRDPSSAFFQPEAARTLSYSSIRKTQALEFAESQADPQTQPIKWSSSVSSSNETTTGGDNDNSQQQQQPDICVAVSSVSRPNLPPDQPPTYLESTLGSVLAGLAPIERSRIYLVVFLAHLDQTVHEAYQQPWLLNMADSLPTYPQDDAKTIETVTELEGNESFDAHVRKQKFDFSVLLAECAKVNPRYILTLDDDIIAVDGWYHRTLNAVAEAEERSVSMEGGAREFLYLRLFYNDGRRLLSASVEDARYVANSAWEGTVMAFQGDYWAEGAWLRYLVGMISVLLIEFVVLFTVRWRSPLVRNAASLRASMGVCLFCTVMMTLLFFAAGRECAAGLGWGSGGEGGRGGSRVSLVQSSSSSSAGGSEASEREGGGGRGMKRPCCGGSGGQGLVFPQHQVVEHLLPAYRDTKDSYHTVDSFLEEVATIRKDLRFAVSPVLMQHVGEVNTHSVLENGTVTDGMPFNFYFETNNAGKLAREHEAWLRDMSRELELDTS